MPPDDYFAKLAVYAEAFMANTVTVTWQFRKPGKAWQMITISQANLLLREMLRYPRRYEGFQLLSVETRVVGAGEEA